MKIKHIIAGAMALALTPALQAQVTVDITGATAFRGAANQAILNAFLSQGALGSSFNYAHTGAAGALNNANRAIFRGKFPGVTGTTTIRTSWNGSVEGIRAVASSDSTHFPEFLTSAALGKGEAAGVSGPLSKARPLMTFSDVAQAATPIKTPRLSGGPVGVVTFAPHMNVGAPTYVTNITSQQFRALFERGSIPLSMLTGRTADRTRFVFVAGRNDGSGTRTTYLAETGYGISRIVRQFVAAAETDTQVTTLQLTRSSANGGAPNVSTLWGQDVDGNGGYVSSSSLRGIMSKGSSNTQVLDAQGNVILPAQQIHIVSWNGTGDVRNCVKAGGKILAYNGEILSSLITADVLNTTDLNKVAEGKYTAWSFQQLLNRGTLTADQNAVRTAIVNGIPAGLGSSGIAMSRMKVGRIGGDGGTVAP